MNETFQYNVVMMFPIIVQHVKEHFMPHGLRRWGIRVQRYALGEGRFTVLYDFPDEKLARSPVNKGGVIGCYFFVTAIAIQLIVMTD
jgi:hypothetical protein